MILLGINAYHGDASAALIIDGRLIAAAEEERFNRIKHSAGFPKQAIKYCLKEAGISIGQVDFIATPRNPKARIFKKIYYGIKVPKLAFTRLIALRKIKNIKKSIADEFGTTEGAIRAKIVNIEHHKAHIASSFFVSRFDKAMLFSFDGFGDFASTMWGAGEGNKFKVLGEVSFPHSLGIYYTAITQYLGFLDYGDEYKVMGLAAYGKPEFKEEFNKIVLTGHKPGFRLGLDYFLHHKKAVDMNFEEGSPTLDLLYSPYLEARLGRARDSLEPIEIRHQNIAASLQLRLEEVILLQLNNLHKSSPDCDNLCLAGGVAFNCSANGKILENSPFKNIYIQPAAGDAGLAVGAAYYLWNQVLNKPRDFVMEHAYWGPKFSSEEIGSELGAMSNELEKEGYGLKQIDDEEELCRITANEIAAGKIVGWFQGRSEWGPRALGNRSILADPRRDEIKDILNKRIKHRETFRPFAPSVPEEYQGEYFSNVCPSPFMLFTFKVKEDKIRVIPAVMHVDRTARLQTVNKNTSPLFYKLIDEFRKVTGVPVLLNTSFNVSEPIVNTPKEALECFLRINMDLLVLNNYVIYKHKPDAATLS